MNPVRHIASGAIIPTQGKVWREQPIISLKAETSGDTLRFAGRPSYPLMKKYGLTASTIPVLAPNGLKVSNKAQLIEKALESMETAKKWQKVGNFSQRYLGTQTLLSNGIWATGVNVELSRDCTLCAERSGLVTAQCKTLDETSLDKLEENPIEGNGKTYIENWNDGLQVETMVLGSAVMGNVPGICSDCENWMTSTRYYSPESRLVWLEKDKKTDTLSLRIQPLSERLPFWGKGQPSISDKPLESLPVKVSDSARQAMKQHGFEEQQLRGLLAQAKARMSQDAHAIFTGKNLATAMVFSSGDTQTASRVDITKRWFVPGDLTAFSLGMQSAQPQQSTKPKTWFASIAEWIQNPWGKLKSLMPQWLQKLVNFAQSGKWETPAGLNRIQAIAYYGNDSDVPPMITTGYFAQPTRGGMDTLLAVIENDEIQIRTIRDYRPLTYISDFQQPAAK